MFGIMHRPTELQSLYIDFDAFFATVEKQVTPALRGKPVGVIAMASEYSALIAQCYIAKAMGCRRQMRVKEARKACPEIVLVPARHDIYVDMHHRIINCVEKTLPVKKVWSIDEVECDLSGFTRAQCLEVAQTIKADLAADIGTEISPSIGLAANQLLAKICAEMEKPRSFVVLHPRDWPGKLSRVPLGDVPGIASGNIVRLRRAGINTLPDLLAISAKHARAIWGSVEGERLWAQLQGYRIERPETQRSMFGHSRNLSGEWQRPEKALECLRLLTTKAARRVRADAFWAQKLTVSLKDEHKRKYRIERQFPPARDDFTFQREMTCAFESLMQAHRGRQLRSIYVMLHDLCKEGTVIDDLFTKASRHKTRQKHEAACDVMDAMNSRYGASYLNIGPQPVIPGGYVGGKIAFGRVPTKEDFASLPPRHGAISRRKIKPH